MQHSQHYIVLDKAEDTHTSVLHLHCTQQHSWLTLVYSQHYIVLDKTERYTHISSTSAQYCIQQHSWLTLVHSQHYSVLDKAEDIHTSVLHLHSIQQTQHSM